MGKAGRIQHVGTRLRFLTVKYYFYFPTAPADTSHGIGFAIGVAMADKRRALSSAPVQSPIKGAHGIDPNVFIDKDGQEHLYYAQGNWM